MDKKKFLQQVYSKIKEKGIPQAEIKGDCINILSDDVVIFKIDSKGGMFYSSDKKIANLVDDLHDKIQPIVTDVGEYLKAMETAPELKAKTLVWRTEHLQSLMIQFLLLQNIAMVHLSLPLGIDIRILCITDISKNELSNMKITLQQILQ